MPVLASSFVFPKSFEKFLQGNMNVASGGNTLTLLLVDSTSSVATQDTAAALTDIVTLGELSGGNYARQTLANQAINIASLATGLVFIDADNVSIANMTQSDIAGAIIINDTEANDQPLAYLDFGAPQSVTASTFTVQFSSQGFYFGSGMGDN